MNYFIEAQNLYTTHQPLINKVTASIGDTITYSLKHVSLNAFIYYIDDELIEDVSFSNKCEVIL